MYLELKKEPLPKYYENLSKTKSIAIKLSYTFNILNFIYSANGISAGAKS